MRDKLVSRTISRTDFFSRKYIRRTLPIMPMVITPSPLLKKVAEQVEHPGQIWIGTIDPSGAADDFLDYLGGSPCVHTKTAFERSSATSSLANAPQRPFSSWGTRQERSQKLASGIRAVSRSADRLCARVEVFRRAKAAGGRPLSRSWSLYDRDHRGTRLSRQRHTGRLD